MSFFFIILNYFKIISKIILNYNINVKLFKIITKIIIWIIVLSFFLLPNNK